MSALAAAVKSAPQESAASSGCGDATIMRLVWQEIKLANVKVELTIVPKVPFNEVSQFATSHISHLTEQ
jgi:pyruvate/2-oxoacid:ferredoxin oxidoreductase beta subunit